MTIFVTFTIILTVTTESLLKSHNIQKGSSWKLLIDQKILFKRKDFAKNDLHTIARRTSADDNISSQHNQQHSPNFPAIG